MFYKKWYQFADCSVPSARDPDVIIEIPAGRHIVIFDDFINRKGNGLECEIGWTGSVARIERSTLDQLVDGGHAAMVGDA